LLRCRSFPLTMIFLASLRCALLARIQMGRLSASGKCPPLYLIRKKLYRTESDDEGQAHLRRIGRRRHTALLRRAREAWACRHRRRQPVSRPEEFLSRQSLSGQSLQKHGIRAQRVGYPAALRCIAEARSVAEYLVWMEARYQTATCKLDRIHRSSQRPGELS